ncbi:MAG: hypothetical protein WAV72_05335 [Bradyrhizobium sp.]
MESPRATSVIEEIAAHFPILHIIAATSSISPVTELQKPIFFRIEMRFVVFRREPPGAFGCRPTTPFAKAKVKPRTELEQAESRVDRICAAELATATPWLAVLSRQTECLN